MKMVFTSNMAESFCQRYFSFQKSSADCHPVPAFAFGPLQVAAGIGDKLFEFSTRNLTSSVIDTKPVLCKKPLSVSWIGQGLGAASYCCKTYSSLS